MVNVSGTYGFCPYGHKGLLQSYHFDIPLLIHVCFQVSLGVTVLLALAVFLLLVAEAMPPQSDSVPLIG